MNNCFTPHGLRILRFWIDLAIAGGVVAGYVALLLYIASAVGGDCACPSSIEWNP